MEEEAQGRVIACGDVGACDHDAGMCWRGAKECQQEHDEECAGGARKPAGEGGVHESVRCGKARCCGHTRRKQRRNEKARVKRVGEVPPGKEGSENNER